MKNEITNAIFTYDERTAQGIAGLVLSVGLPFLDSLNSSIQVVGGLGGLVLLWLGIRYKYLQVQELKAKRKNHEKAD